MTAIRRELSRVFSSADQLKALKTNRTQRCISL